ncbi:hypothetical protein [Haloarcula sp. JP-L23]|uniref:hypothetical protein n=1 Tax=Haloarcula sp. JP-L23 TaxID=2716717 RepID=UPI00140EDF19|nr:hypothetical protein G9465_25005 [Haloarcula sp. JP-L23]
MPDDDTVLACPDCDSTGIRARVQNGYGAPTHDDDYYCRHCGHSFDEPVERERHDESGLPGLAGRLDRMDPDDVGGEPVTDGGDPVVYYATGQYDVYHENRDCRYLKQATSIRESSLRNLAGFREPCGVCASPEDTVVTDGGTVEDETERYRLVGDSCGVVWYLYIDQDQALLHSVPDGEANEVVPRAHAYDFLEADGLSVSAVDADAMPIDEPRPNPQAVADGGRSLDERLTRLEREVFDDEDEDPEIRADGGQSVSETERSWDGGGQKTIREESMERRRNSRGISRSAVAGLIEEHGESGVLYLRNERKYASIWLRIVETQVWSYTEQASGATFTRETTLSNILRHKRGEYEVVGADEAPIEWKTVADGDGNFCDVHTETDHDIRTDGGAREMRYAGCSVPLRRGFTDLTVRLASEWRDLAAGDRLEMLTDDDVVPVTVTDTQSCSAADAYLIANAADGHVSYASFGEFLTVMQGYYPEAGVDAQTQFVCVAFEVDADAALDHAESDPQEVSR